MDMSGDRGLPATQTALDPAFPSGGRYFFKSHFLDAIDRRRHRRAARLRRRTGPPRVADRHPDASGARSPGSATTRAPTRTVAPGTTSASTPPGPTRRWTPRRSAGPARRGTRWRLRHRRGVRQLRRPRRRSRPRRGVRDPRRAPRRDRPDLRPRRHPHRGERPALRRSHQLRDRAAPQDRRRRHLRRGRPGRRRAGGSVGRGRGPGGG